MSGSTGNLPPGVFAVNFVAEDLSQVSSGGISYNLSTTENMELAITPVQTPPPPPTNPPKLGARGRLSLSRPART